jgi:hypothetical protein
MPRAKTPKGSKKAKEGASKLKADAAQQRRAAQEERDRQEEDRERRAEEARAERERNPHVFTFDHSRIRCDEDFHRSIYEQGLGYADYWAGAKWSRLNDMLCGGFGVEPPFIVKVFNYGQAQQDPDEFAVGAELLASDAPYRGGYANYEGCVVEEVTETGYKVLFTESGPYCDRQGKREKLPRERLRSRVDLERFRICTKTKELLLQHRSIRSIATYENLI